jgi:Acetyl-CoA hydrolase/transferase C-terminal domain
MLMGTSRLYRFADRNSAIQMRATSYTHDALVLGNFRRFVAINGALEELCQFDPVFEGVVAIGTIARMCPQPGRLMPDTIHVEGIQSDLLWHLVPLAPAGCGTYTIGDYGRSDGISA